MNRLVVLQTTAGLARYMLAQGGERAARGVVVGFDGRHKSREFAEDVACCLATHGIKSWLATEVTPTPLCAFAIPMLGAAAGVVITASHNPPEYNGYKLYWDDGAQIVPPVDHDIAAEIDVVAQGPLNPAPLSLEAARASGLCLSWPHEIVDRYLTSVSRPAFISNLPDRQPLCVAYTPLHGVGADLVERAVKRSGVAELHTVKAQREPDGAFPTVRFPNPEEPGAMDLVLDLASEVDATLAIANDPDADRLAVAVRQTTGKYQQLTGDQVGILLGLDMISRYANANSDNGEISSPPPVVATTIVSSRLLGTAAASLGADYFETLTGFKWLAKGAIDAAARGAEFLLGYEEALGYTVGSAVRDKDGIKSLVEFIRLVQRLRDEGKTALDELEAIYRRFGVHLTAQRSLNLSPDADAAALGQSLRNAQPRSIAGHVVDRIVDVASQTMTTTGTTEVSPVDLPISDVLVYFLDDDSRIIVRPSGTEPKIKCYYEVISPVSQSDTVAAATTAAQKRLTTLIDTHQSELAAL